MSSDYIPRLRAELLRAGAAQQRRSRWASVGRPLLPALARLRPSPQTLVALAAVLALVAVVLAVWRESDVERPAAPRPQPTANADTPPVWTPQEQRMDALRERAIRDENPDGLSARQVANRWAQLFASGEEIRTFPATDSPGKYMSQPAEALTRCMDDAGVVERPIEGCTPPSAEFRKSFQRASVERIVISGRKASATFTNGEVVELWRTPAADVWMIENIGEDAGRGFFK